MREMKDSGIEWIGEIPKDWKITRVGNHFYFYSGDSLTSEDLNDDGIYPVYGANGIRGFYNKKNLTGSHIILGRVGALCGNVHLVDSELWVTEHALVSVPFTEYTINEFYKYMFETMNFRQYSKASAQPVLSAEVLRQLKMPIPKVGEQKRIADYLDEKCTKIEAIIEKQQKIIEKIKEYKLSVITEAVTKGLNPNVEMKDSGVEWIGEIPAHWSLVKAKYYVDITNGSDPKEEGDIPVYGSGEKSFKTCGEYKEGPCVLIGRKGATLNIPHYIMGKYWNVDTAFDVKTKKGMLLKYYFYLANCFDYNRFISQTTLPGMTQTNYNNMLLPVPSIDEQEDIVRYVDEKVKKIDCVLDNCLKLVDNNANYKRSLIYEVVTGKREV